MPERAETVPPPLAYDPVVLAWSPTNALEYAGRTLLGQPRLFALLAVGIAVEWGAWKIMDLLWGAGDGALLLVFPVAVTVIVVCETFTAAHLLTVLRADPEAARVRRGPGACLRIAVCGLFKWMSIGCAAIPLIVLSLLAAAKFGAGKPAHTVALAAVMFVFALPPLGLVLGWSFMKPLIIEGRSDPVEACTVSWRMTRGRKWELSVLLLFSLLLLAAGIFPLWLGVPLVVPVLRIAWTHTYFALSLRQAA